MLRTRHSILGNIVIDMNARTRATWGPRSRTMMSPDRVEERVIEIALLLLVAVSRKEKETMDKREGDAAREMTAEVIDSVAGGGVTRGVTRGRQGGKPIGVIVPGHADVLRILLNCSGAFLIAFSVAREGKPALKLRLGEIGSKENVGVISDLQMTF